MDTRSLDVFESVASRDLTLYAYGMNNPLTWIDPEGLEGIKGDDPVYRALKEAAEKGDGDAIDRIESLSNNVSMR
jgi:hypothetical protein